MYQGDTGYLGTDTVVDHSVSYTLDAGGNLTPLTDKTGTTTWTYDENNRVTSESRTQNAVTQTASYSYHTNGLMLSMTTFAGEKVNYTYDASLRLSSQSDPKDGSRAIGYNYDARSRRTAIIYPSGVRQDVGFDKAGRVATLKLVNSNGTLLQSFTYNYGFDSTGARTAEYAKGNVVSFAETTAGLADSAVKYGYDEYNRLISTARTGQDPFTHSYVYDLNNNRTSVTKNGTTTTATYDYSNQLIKQGTVDYTYDRNGNLVDAGAPTYSYDAANQMTGGVTGAGTQMEYGYDGLGRRTHQTQGSSRTDYWYDASGMSLESGGTSATYLRDPGGKLLSSWTGGVLQNYATDRLGSVTATTNTSGGLTNTYRYDPWGTLVGYTGNTYR